MVVPVKDVTIQPTERSRAQSLNELGLHAWEKTIPFQLKGSELRRIETGHPHTRIRVTNRQRPPISPISPYFPTSFRRLLTAAVLGGDGCITIHNDRATCLRVNRDSVRLHLHGNRLTMIYKECLAD